MKASNATIPRQKKHPHQGNIWIIDPFMKDSEYQTPILQENFAKLVSTVTLRYKFKMSHFIRSAYLQVKNIPMFQIIVTFSNIYFCGESFSAVSVIKTKFRNRMWQLTEIFENICDILKYIFM